MQRGNEVEIPETSIQYNHEKRRDFMIEWRRYNWSSNDDSAKKECQQ